jgi:hypothetical protein
VSVLVGLCAACSNARVIESRRGSRFWLCALSRTDPRFPRYPSLPVLRCAGFEKGTAAFATAGQEQPLPEPAPGPGTTEGGDE